MRLRLRRLASRKASLVPQLLEIAMRANLAVALKKGVIYAIKVPRDAGRPRRRYPDGTVACPD